MKIDKEKILKFLESPEYTPMIIKELYKKFDLRERTDRKRFRGVLKDMVASGELFKTSDNRFTAQKPDELTGRLEFVKSGKMAFIQASDGNEYVVFPENTKDAMHRDTVKIKAEGNYREWQRARVISVIKRNLTRVVGVLIKEGKRYYVIPDDKRVGYRFAVQLKNVAKDLKGAKAGEKVYGEITAYPNGHIPPKVKIKEVLGKIDDPKVHLPSIILKHGLPFPDEFPESVIAEKAEIPSKVINTKDSERKDFRDRLIFTIDGETAKDFDDAVSIERLENGNYKLGVYIADVSHYVKPGTAIDREAFERSTSVYLINTVIPMLPFELSNGICSLKPNVNRLVVSVEMEIDKTGKVLDFEVANGIIRSKRRLTYTIVNDLFEKKDKKAERSLSKTPGLIESLETMNELASILRENRRARGAIIGIESGEVYIKLDEEGHTVDIIPRNRHMGESLIEEFMIKANEVIATMFMDADLPFIYRIHEIPENDTLMQLKSYIIALGVENEMPRTLTSATIQKLLESLSDNPLRNSVERLVVRTMKRAIYDESNIGHYGLASEAYTHFTSPIRRYPDLIVHRLIKEYLSGESFSEERMKYWQQYLPVTATHCTQKERVANESEWDLIALKKVDYIKSHASEIFDVVATNISKIGIFVEVKDLLIPGLIHISTLMDFFIYDEKRNVLVGENTHKLYKLGDILTVRVKNIDFVRGEVDFEMV
ncbi:MAG TPA: ribonuclease R [Thermotogota bacterium]|nr:ribonuclease R [Thermotogota bacterium]